MWWQYVIAAVVLIIAVYGFVSLVKVQTHRVSDKTDHTAEDVYDRYAESPRQQHRYARQRGGEWRNE
jgi:uncharacterized membrane protein